MTVIRKKRFGDILVDGGLISATQLQQALSYGREMNVKLGEALKNLGFVNEKAIAKTIAKQLNIPFVDLSNVIIDREIVHVIPEIAARKYKLIALGRRPGELLVAFADPLDIYAVDDISNQIDDKLVISVALESSIMTAIDTYYAPDKDESPAEVIDESAAVSAINDLILQAVRDKTSDIHIEPTGDKLRIRNRIDGMLRVSRDFPLQMHAGMVSRLKIMSNLDIGEKRKPQDGRFEIPVSGKSFDVRVSTLPLKNGEKVVLRLLDKSNVLIDLKHLGFEPRQLELFKEYLGHPHQIILVTGPTGSGKTTTLYGALNFINSLDKNIITVEDPVEYEILGINQVQLNPRAELTFSSALRSILRQDPDVVMIGEIRDVETAEIAIQAALTGHLVLSTLHTNDSPGAISRLADMGIPPFLIASALGLVLAQHLLRLLCPHCKENFTPPPSLWKDLGLQPDDDQTIYRSVGCDRCDQIGYKGRIGIYEVLEVTHEVEKLIMENASSHAIFRQANKEGLIPLRKSGLNKMLAGLTSLEEVLRVSMDTEKGL